MEENKEEKKENVNVENKTEQKNNSKTNSKTESKKATGDKKVEEKEKTKKASTESKKENVNSKDETKFKKVEVKNKEKNEKKKSHIVLKTILIIIGILVVAYFIFVMRNYFILNDILEKANNYRNINNFSYEATSKVGDLETNTKYYKKDNIDRLESNNNQENKLIVWRDLNTNEGIIACPENNVAVRVAADERITINPFLFEFVNANEAINGLGLYAFIYSDEYNGVECYVIQADSESKTWVEKDTGLVLKETRKNMEVNCVSYEVDSVDEVFKPDLTGYEIK